MHGIENLHNHKNRVDTLNPRDYTSWLPESNCRRERERDRIPSCECNILASMRLMLDSLFLSSLPFVGQHCANQTVMRENTGEKKRLYIVEQISGSGRRNLKSESKPICQFHKWTRVIRLERVPALAPRHFSPPSFWPRNRVQNFRLHIVSPICQIPITRFVGLISTANSKLNISHSQIVCFLSLSLAFLGPENFSRQTAGSMCVCMFAELRNLIKKFRKSVFV